MYDFHMHSEHSIDSKQPLEGIVERCLELGLEGFAVTDHANMRSQFKYSMTDMIADSIRDLAGIREKYKGQLRVFTGVECADHPDYPEIYHQVMALGEYDVVLGSVHTVPFENWCKDQVFAKEDLRAPDVTVDKLQRYSREYYRQVQRVADFGGVNVLCHLNLPYRYINGKFGWGLDVNSHKDAVCGILETIISKGISLEINTDGVGKAYDDTLPSREIISWYRDMGGKMVTIGSDAHKAENIANGFNRTIQMLKEVGYKESVGFEKQQPFAIPL